MLYGTPCTLVNWSEFGLVIDRGRILPQGMRRPRGAITSLSKVLHAHDAASLISALLVMASRFGFTIKWSRLWLQGSALTI